MTDIAPEAGNTEPRYQHHFVVIGQRETDGTLSIWLDGGETMTKYDDRPVYDTWEAEFIGVSEDRQEDDSALDRLIKGCIDVDADGLPTGMTEDDAWALLRTLSKRFGWSFATETIEEKA